MPRKQQGVLMFPELRVKDVTIVCGEKDVLNHHFVVINERYCTFAVHVDMVIILFFILCKLQKKIIVKTFHSLTYNFDIKQQDILGVGVTNNNWVRYKL